MRIDALQRLVVRMTIDPGFAAAVLEGRADPGLDPEALGWLRAVDPRAWGAERGRCAQMLGNLAGEYPLAVQLAVPGALESFPSSDTFHAAIAEDRPLPLAFGEHLLGRALPTARDATLLELEVARARRLRPPLPPAPIRTAPGVRLVRLAAGTADWASAAAEARVRGAAPSMPPPSAGEELAVLAPRPTGSWQLPEVRVEVLAGPVAILIGRAATGLHRSDLLSFAVEYGAETSDVEALVRELVHDGILDQSAVDV